MVVMRVDTGTGTRSAGQFSGTASKRRLGLAVVMWTVVGVETVGEVVVIL